MSPDAGTVVGSLRPQDVVGSFDGPVGAYVHVPFCEWTCPFCPYNKVLAEGELTRRYFVALAREVDWYLAARSDAGQAPGSPRSCSLECCAPPRVAAGSPLAASRPTTTWKGW